MSTVPTPDRSIVDAAVDAVRDFGATTKLSAEAALNFWSGKDELTEAQRAEVIAHFDRRRGTCVHCAGPVEYVPTPAGADPDWHGPFWRHVNLDDLAAPHAAEPRDVTR